MEPGLAPELFALLILAVLSVLPGFWAIRKAGWSGWWCLLLVVPAVNLVFVWVFAFARWPAEPPG